MFPHDFEVYFFFFISRWLSRFPKGEEIMVSLPKDTHAPVCRKETSVEVSRGGGEPLFSAGLWEFIARHWNASYKVSNMLMS